MAQLQAGKLARDHAVGGVGEKPGDPVPVGIGEPQLRAGMRALLAQDQSGPGRPFRQVHQIGGLGHPGAVADAAVGLHRRIPPIGGVEGVDRVADPSVDRAAQREPHRGVAARGGEPMGGAGGVRADQDLWRVRVIRARAVLRWQRIECLAQHGDVIGGGVTAGVARPQQPGQGLPGGDVGRPKTSAASESRRCASRSRPRSPCCRNDRR